MSPCSRLIASECAGQFPWQLERLPERASGYSLDLDSTVFVSPLPCVVKSSFVALYSVAGHRLVVHLSSSWGGLQRRILLLENVLAFGLPIQLRRSYIRNPRPGVSQGTSCGGGVR